MGSIREKSNIAIAILDKWRIWTYPSITWESGYIPHVPWPITFQVATGGLLDKFQYCDSNIELFFIASPLVIALPTLR